MDIQSLLNPDCGEHHGYRRSESPRPTVMPDSGPPKKVAKKDAPIFSEGNRTVGFVNYPPYEAGDNKTLVTEHKRYRLYPQDEIHQKGVRHIPYNSDKKDFLDKTGRDSFEVYHYTYKVPGEEKEYVVIWDYNVGLVRMTPFFKSCKYTKTIPAKALKVNPGLKDITYSITGGALVCQGYWVPYQAAKAIAATFCYNIRWALTPVFGNDFPAICVPPGASTFAKFSIDSEIVQYCTAETDRFREEGAAYRVSTSDASSSTATPKLQLVSPLWESKTLKQLPARPADLDNGYRTEPDHSDKCAVSPQVSPPWTPMTGTMSSSSFSPQVSPRSRWTPPNKRHPFLTPITTTSSATCSPLIQELTPIPDEQPNEQPRTKRSHSNVTLSDHGDDETATRPQTARDVNSDIMLSIESTGPPSPTASVIEAAEILLSIRYGGNKSTKKSTPPVKRTRRGSTTRGSSSPSSSASS